MNMGLEFLVLIFALGGAWLAACFAAMIYFRSKQRSGLLTAQGAAQLLRAETDIVRSAVEDQAGRLRLRRRGRRTRPSAQCGEQFRGQPR